MRIGNVDTDNEILVIAEIGNNHEGSFDVAMRLVAHAADTGVQAVKFQTFRTEHFVSPSQVERFARMQKFQLSQGQFSKLADEARNRGLLFISTPLDIGSATFLSGIVDAMKIASGDNTFYPLIEVSAESGKPMILSTGLATMAEIGFATGLVQRVWQRQGTDPGLALLHCVAAYPVPPEDANVGAVATIRDAFGLTTGYSDHTIGMEAALLAVGAGARIIEKHFTLDTNFSDFRDHQLSADPKMMTQLVSAVKQANRMLGSGVKAPVPAEIASIEALRRSIASAVDIAAGTLIEPDHITWIRPGGGLAPGAEYKVLGRRARKAIPAGTMICAADIE